MEEPFRKETDKPRRRTTIVLLRTFPFVILGLDPRIHEPRTPDMSGYVYIVTSQPRGTLYTGVTSDLERRIYEHREGVVPGFTSRYGCTRLVWYEENTIISAPPSSGKSP